MVELGINNFISGDKRSLEIAGRIEVALDELFPQDEEIQDYVTCFASYRPVGGQYLYNEYDILEKCKCLLNALQSRK